MNIIINESKYTRDFCLLLIKLFQKPDLELSELWSLLINEFNDITSSMANSFRDELSLLTENGIESLVEYIDNLIKMMEADNNSFDYFFIAKSSVVGGF